MGANGPAIGTQNGTTIRAVQDGRPLDDDGDEHLVDDTARLQVNDTVVRQVEQCVVLRFGGQ